MDRENGATTYQTGTTVTSRPPEPHYKRNADDELSCSSAFNMLWDYITGIATAPPAIPDDATTRGSFSSERTSLLHNSYRDEAKTAGDQNNETVQETPHLIIERQDQLDWELEAIEVKPAYDYALKQSRRYVHALRLMFLRATNFDAKAAAIRMATFFEAKLQLFGPDVLCRHIRQSDLDPDDLASLQSGCCQVLPIRDKANRTVVCYFPKQHVYKDVKNMIKAWWYLSMAVLEEDEATRRKRVQRDGITFIVYHVGPVQLTDVDQKLYWQVVGSLRQLPVRNSGGVHFCFNDFKIRHISSLFSYYNSMTAEKSSSSQFHFHEGSHIECQYSLLDCGIPARELPMTKEGEWKNGNHTYWLNKRKTKEQEEGSVNK